MFVTDFSICFTIKYPSLTNSPCLFHRKCKENSVENMNTNVLGCERLKVKWGTQGEHTQFYKTHTAGSPFATLKTEGSNHLHISLQMGCSRYYHPLREWGHTPPTKIVKTSMKLLWQH